MNINRHNYETHFLLYADNELDAESRKEVDAFVNSNPDLAVELESIMRSVLSPGLVSFADKNELLKLEAEEMELLMNSLDNESHNPVALQDMLQHNPVAAREWALLKKTVLPAESVLFPNKSSLYRHAAGRVVGIRWYRAAAAILLLAGLSAVGYMLMTSNNSVDSVSSRPVNKEISKPANQSNTAPEISVPEISPVQKQDATVNNISKTETPRSGQIVNAPVPQKQAPTKSNNTIVQDAPNNNMVKTVPEDKKPSNNLPTPALQNINKNESNPSVASNVLLPNKTNEVSNPVQNISNNSGSPDNENNLVKTVAYTEPDQVETENDNRILFMREEKLKKTKLGGLFTRARAKLQSSFNRKGNGIKIANIEITSL